MKNGHKFFHVQSDGLEENLKYEKSNISTQLSNQTKQTKQESPETKVLLEGSRNAEQINQAEVRVFWMLLEACADWWTSSSFYMF